MFFCPFACLPSLSSSFYLTLGRRLDICPPIILSFWLLMTLQLIIMSVSVLVFRQQVECNTVNVAAAIMEIVIQRSFSSQFSSYCCVSNHALVYHWWFHNLFWNVLYHCSTLSHPLCGSTVSKIFLLHSYSFFSVFFFKCT